MKKTADGEIAVDAKIHLDFNRRLNMSLWDVLEIGFETGLEVLKGKKTIEEGVEDVYEKTKELEEEQVKKGIFQSSKTIKIGGNKMETKEIMTITKKTVVTTGTTMAGGLAGCSGGAVLGFVVGGPVGAAVGWTIGLVGGVITGGTAGAKITKKIGD